MIAFACACGTKLTVKDELAGERAQCPKCKKAIVVPTVATNSARMAAGTPAPPPSPKVTQAQGPPPPSSPLEVTAPQLDDTPSSPEVGVEKLDFLAPAQQPDELGRLGPYRVLKVLGAGGMGMVLQAEDPLLKRTVALKVMRPELAARDTNRQRFLREAQATAAIEHDHIVHIHQVGEDRGVPFIAMPFLKGEPLDARLKREGRLPIAEVIRIGRQIAEGLTAAHEHGLIHRDIKPGNIWLEAKTGRVKIVDFGLARGVAGDDVNLTKTGTILGTPAYMAPEQAAANPVDHRADLFSLGAVLYRMVTGELPFQGADTMSLLLALATKTPKAIRELNPAVPPALADLVMRLLEKDAAARPTSARAVTDALAELEGVQIVDEMPRPPGSGPAFPLRRRRLLIAMSAFLIVLGVGLSLLFRPDHNSVSQLSKDSKTRPDPDIAPLETIKNSLDMELVLIPPGKFKMGQEEIIAPVYATPVHDVEITKSFYMGKHEVTRGQFRKFVERAKYTEAEKNGGHGVNATTGADEEGMQYNWKNPGFEQTDDHPVVMVSWDDAQKFCAWLSAQERKKYRLPTEAEWEYCCRAGTTTLYGYGNDPDGLALVGNVADASLRKKFPAWVSGIEIDDGYVFTAPVGKFKANRFGLHDMQGNVYEWCQDWYDTYTAGPQTDPQGPQSGSNRVFRGGSFRDTPLHCRCADRGFPFYGNVPSSRICSRGFRVVRE